MAYDFEHCDGFDKYGWVGRGLGLGDMYGDWNTGAGSGFTLSVGSSLQGPGSSLVINNTSLFSGTSWTVLFQSLPGYYARSVGTVYINPNNAMNYGLSFMDGGTCQLSIGFIATTGRVGVWRGDINGGTLLGQSPQAILSGTTHTLQWDVTIGSSVPIKLWLDGAIAISLTGQNTQATGTAGMNGYGPAVQSSYYVRPCTYDHLWSGFHTAVGGTDTPPLTNAIIGTNITASDSTPIGFTPGTGILGPAVSQVGTTGSPGANILALRPVTPAANMTLNSITIVPEATSSTANYRPVVYADASGIPGALVQQGPQVTGVTSGTALNMPMTSGVALTAGTQYWIGFITDTSVALLYVDGSTPSRSVANTYTSGAPATAPAMTGNQPSWWIYGICTGQAHNWPQLQGGIVPAGGIVGPPLYDSSYNVSQTVGAEDLFNFTPLAGTPSNIYTSAVKAFMRVDAAGAHTVQVLTKSGSITSNGSNPGVNPSPINYAWVTSFFDNDPNTSAAWTQTGLNAAPSGYTIQA